MPTVRKPLSRAYLPIVRPNRRLFGEAATTPKQALRSTQTISTRFVVNLRARGFGSAACLLPRLALGVLAPAPHAIESPLSKVRLRRVRRRKVRHIKSANIWPIVGRHSACADALIDGLPVGISPASSPEPHHLACEDAPVSYTHLTLPTKA